MPPFARSILSILAGYLTMVFIVIILTVLCIKILHLQSGHPTPAYLTLNLIYSAIAAAIGGIVAATVAGYRPIAHGIILGAVLFGMSLLSFKSSAGGQPLAYRIVVIAILPLATVGGAALMRRSPVAASTIRR